MMDQLQAAAYLVSWMQGRCLRSRGALPREVDGSQMCDAELPHLGIHCACGRHLVLEDADQVRLHEVHEDADSAQQLD